MKSKIHHNEVSLCSYFWNVIFMIFCNLFVVFMAIVVLYPTIGFWVSLISNGIFGHLLFSIHTMKIGMILNFLFGFFIIMILIGHWCTEYVDNKPEKPAKKQTLLGQYLRAKKEKFCPFIEIE